MARGPGEQRERRDRRDRGSPEERAEHERFEEEFRRYNIEAVRRQMEEGAPG